MHSPKHLAVYYTGGTIGMQQTPAGLAPAANLASLAAPIFQEYSHQLKCDWFICEPLIDSSAITLSNWETWINWIDSKAENYDGLLILHGTDTMAYSANIIALARPQLNIPIILTGAMLPLEAANSDANLQFGSLAQWSESEGWFNTNLPVVGNSDLSAQYDISTSARIHCFTLTPGANLTMITASLTHNPPDGVILQSYGNGNTPNDRNFLTAIRQISEQSIPVLNISQVLQGCASAVYAQGHELRAAGVINGGKCNLETAVAILTLAVSNNWNKEQIENLLHTQKLI